MKSDVRQKEVIRGKMLQYLSLIYPRAATLALLQGELDILGFPASAEELHFHVAYLAEKRLVAVESPIGPHAQRKIPLVKVTALGIDYLDGRLPADEGIYLEPQS